jgi:hypothetical protein
MLQRVIVVAFMVAACRESSVDRLTAIKTRVCACKTASCAETALREVPQQTIESNHRTQAIARDMLDCMARLYDGERPSDDAEDDGNRVPTAPETSAPASARTP